MPSKTRISNKVGWGLDAIQDEIAEAERAWGVIQDRLRERFPDSTALIAMGDLRNHLANIKTRAHDARSGEFNEGM